MPTHPTLMPLDKCEYTAQVPLHPDFLLQPKAFARARGLLLYKVVRKPSGRDAKFKFDIMGCRGLSIQVSKARSQRLAQLTVTANPGRVLRGHNGQVLLENEFHDFGAIVMHHLTPLVSKPSVVPDLFPGLQTGGPARWTYLELLLHIRDPDGTVFQKLRHASHPDIPMRTRCWNGESIELGRKKGEIQFSIYYKAKEMRANTKQCRSLSREFDDILRLEVRLRGSQLAKYVGSLGNVEKRTTTNVEQIEGTWIETVSVEKCLVRFTAGDLFRALHKLFGELRGVWSSDCPRTPCKLLERMGNFLGAEACCSGLSLSDLLSIMKAYLGPNWDNDKSRIRKAAVEELEHRSGLSLSDLLGAEHYHFQPGIPVPPLERLVKHGPDHIRVPWELTRAYTPVDRRFRPHVSIPTYFDCDETTAA